FCFWGNFNKKTSIIYIAAVSETMKRRGMKTKLYQPKNEKSKLIVLLLILFLILTAVEIHSFAIRLSLTILVAFIGYQVLLKGDYRIAYDSEYLFLDSLFKPKRVLLKDVVEIKRNTWYSS
ncbi:MAG TPA: hypothetical protein VD794_13790, partial [Flavisolibacter sp.]|nr:hypothetical protein [Flavisolibacter sp.]